MKRENDKRDADNERKPVPETSPTAPNIENQIVGDINSQVQSPHTENDEYNKPPNEWKDSGKPRVKLSKGEWIALFTLAAIFAQNFLIYWTLGEVAKTTKATEVQARANLDQLPLLQRSVKVAEDSVDAANKQADASLAQAKVSERMAQQNEDLIQSAQIQANTSQIAARAAETGTKIAQELLRLERPFISVMAVEMRQLEASKPVVVVVKFQNTGRTEALHARVSNRLVQGPLEGCPSEYADQSFNTSTSGLPSKTTIAVGAVRFGNPRSLKPISTSDIEDIKAGRRWVYVSLLVRYESNGGGKYTMTYYSRYNPETNSFDECPIGNESN
jgi:hypothetical protein